jgi:hypothetical protein
MSGGQNNRPFSVSCALEVETANQDAVSGETRLEIIRPAHLCPFQADKFLGWDQDSALVESVISCLS